MTQRRIRSLLLRHGALGVLALAAFTGLNACSQEPSSRASEDVADSDISFEEFMSTVSRDATGAYIVEGDMRFADLDALANYYRRYVRQGALAVLQVNGVDSAWSATAKLHITYCVSSSGFGTNYATVVNAMEGAGNAWERVANVHFQHVNTEDGNCTNSNNNVVFNVAFTSGTSFNAQAFFPTDARASRQLFVDFANATNAAPKTLTGILTHELGHTLGFVHEHGRTVACNEGLTFRALTEYDSASVMHYPPFSAPTCGGTNMGDYAITARDARGVASLYGSATFRAGKFFSSDEGAIASDWDSGFRKGTSTPGFAVTGLSQFTNHQAADALLSFPGAGEFGGNLAATLVNNNADVRRLSRLADWDSGFVKFECGSNEYISGMSQAASSPFRTHAFRCASGSLPNGGQNSCEKRVFSDGDDRGMSASGEWDASTFKGECAAGKIAVGVSVYPDTATDTTRRGHPHALLCCSGLSTSPAFDFSEHDAGFVGASDWDAGNFKGRCAPAYGMTGLSQLTDHHASASVLCSPSTAGEFREASNTVLVNTGVDVRRAARSGDWDSGRVKFECGNNEYLTGISQGPATPFRTHAVMCTGGTLTNNGNNGCETRTVSDGDDRGNTSTGEWDGGRFKAECAAGKVALGVSVYPDNDPDTTRRGHPHKILCCNR